MNIWLGLGELGVKLEKLYRMPKEYFTFFHAILRKIFFGVIASNCGSITYYLSETYSIDLKQSWYSKVTDHSCSQKTVIQIIKKYGNHGYHFELIWGVYPINTDPHGTLIFHNFAGKHPKLSHKKWTRPIWTMRGNILKVPKNLFFSQNFWNWLFVDLVFNRCIKCYVLSLLCKWNDHMLILKPDKANKHDANGFSIMITRNIVAKW